MDGVKHQRSAGISDARSDSSSKYVLLQVCCVLRAACRISTVRKDSAESVTELGMATTTRRMRKCERDRDVEVDIRMNKYTLCCINGREGLSQSDALTQKRKT